MDRWEYVVAGSPLEEISIAEPLANTGILFLYIAVPSHHLLAFPAAMAVPYLISLKYCSEEKFHGR